MRQLASIQKVLDIQPIEGKDRIELLSVLGWKVVAEKGEFKPGDMCVYIEPDTLLPEREEFEFLRARCYSKKFGGFRIRPMKLGNVYSQGIVFPVSILGSYRISEGIDVSELLGIKPYDPEEEPTPRKKSRWNWFIGLMVRLGFKSFNKRMPKYWPSFASRSDETRLGAIPHILKYFETYPDLYVTEKLDGQSVLFFFYKGEFGVCSRNRQIARKDTSGDYFWKIAEQLDLENKLRAFGQNIGIQGELCGPGIQKNPLGLKEKQAFFYQIQQFDGSRFLDYNEFKMLCKELNLPVVPVLYEGKCPYDTVEDWTQYAVRNSVLNTEKKAEGIVVRSTKEVSLDHMPTVRQRASFKVINPEY
jgi:hypothetical protein